jgi:hypothetical protein
MRPGSGHVFFEGLLAVCNVVPQSLHVVDFVGDSFFLLSWLINGLGVSEFLSVVAKVLNLIFVNSDFTENSIKLEKGVLTTTVVLKEFTLLHLLLESFEFLIESLYFVLVSSRGSLERKSNLFLGVFCCFFKHVPFIEQLVGLLLVRFLG